MKLISLIAAAALVASSYATARATSHETAASKAPASTDLSAAILTEGEVRKVDMEARKITLKHGPIANLGMPAMSMVFRVKDAAFLEKVKAGDKVQFSADKVDGAITITGIQVAN